MTMVGTEYCEYKALSQNKNTKYIFQYATDKSAMVDSSKDSSSSI
jgi:hypothetical protein